jgi:cytochrome c-type biogenesis protein CcmF
MADIGYIALLLALVASIYSAVAFVVGTRGRYPELVASARNGVYAACGLVSLAALALIYALVTHDFQVEYVASYTSLDMSLKYTLSAFWAGNAGSLLLWTWLLSIFAAIVVFQNRNKNRELIPYASVVMMVTLAFFIILGTFVANPFEKLTFAPADGMGLNPLLENPGMLIHPPTVLIGYAGFTVPFAFAIAALLTRRLGDEWIKAVRRWTIFAWLSLGIGNILGAHSIIMQRRRGMLKRWNIVLIILTFNLAIFGTFLTRSGILSSVHAFGESTLGTFFLVFIGVALVGSLGLLFYRREHLKSEAEMDSLISRESSFLLNNLVLVGATFAIFLGTIFPVISEAVRGTKITVGAPFFNQVVGPIFLVLILLTGICVFLGWRRASTKKLIRNFLYPLIGALVLCLVLFSVGIREWYALALFPLCVFVAGTHLFAWYREVRARGHLKVENPLKAFFGLLWANKPRYGGMIVHLGIVLIAMGVIGSSFYQVEKEAALLPGDQMTIKGYALTYEGMSFYETPSKQVVTAKLSVYNGDKRVGELTPEKYFHRTHQQPVTEVAIRSTPLEDLYVILGGWAEDGTTTFVVLVNPLVSWIWIGGVVLLLGGLIAFWPDRRKQ